MARFALTLGIGLVSGLLSGAFGIGGGVITTPAIRLILGAPALAAVATPLPVIIPGALTGAVSYTRERIADVRAGVLMGLGGAVLAVLGAWLATRVGGSTVLLVTAALVIAMAVDMTFQALRSPAHPEPPGAESDPALAPTEDAAAERRVGGSAASPAEADRDSGPLRGLSERRTPRPSVPPPAPAALALLGIGAVAGLYSGFLGLGGGFVLVPLMTRFLRFDMKRAVGTSLVAISILSVPGTITFAILGKIDWAIALPLALGVVPGAWLGSKAAMRASDRWLRLGFAALLLVAAVLLAGNELGWLHR